MTQEKFTFFFHKTHPFSNHNLVRHKRNGIIFNCVEQDMMYSKAVLFKDFEIAELIVAETEPNAQKKLGRRVRNFHNPTWLNHCKHIVYHACHAKFTQNPEYLEKLLATKGTTLVEASPYDDLWGIKLSANDPRAQDRRYWQGKNYLGEVLTKLRDDLIAEGWESKV